MLGYLSADIGLAVFVALPPLARAWWPFNDEFDRQFSFNTKSVLCVAIRIGSSVCGVIELLNRRGGAAYRSAEQELLEIFAQYISSTIQNAVDAKKIERMVRIDDLTANLLDESFEITGEPGRLELRGRREPVPSARGQRSACACFTSMKR